MEVESFEGYLEVAEIARRLGISTTTVYNRLKKDWAPFMRKEHGLTLVSVEVLKEEKVLNLEEKTDESLKDGVGALKDAFPEVGNLKDELIQRLKDQIESLKHETERMERLLDDANRKITEKDATITSLSERLADLTERALKTTEQAQFLTAQAQAAAALPEPEEDEGEKRGFLGLFKRKK